MAVEKMVIPVGFQFQPQDSELICYYLYKKSRGEPLKEHEENVIVERQLYGKDASPWNVLKEDDSWQDADAFGSKKVIYVFSKVTPMKKGGDRISRMAGCGKWDGKGVTQDITLSVGGCYRVIGHRTPYTFRVKNGYESEAARKGHWIMHEYSFPSSTDKKDENGDSWVICRITKELVEVGKDGKKRKLVDIYHDNGADDHIAADYDDRIVSKDEMNMEKKRMCIINGGKSSDVVIEGSEVFNVTIPYGGGEEGSSMINNYPNMASTFATTCASDGYLSDIVGGYVNTRFDNVSSEPLSLLAPVDDKQQQEEFLKLSGVCDEAHPYAHNKYQDNYGAAGFREEEIGYKIPLIGTSDMSGAAVQGYSCEPSSSAAVDFQVEALLEQEQQKKEEQQQEFLSLMRGDDRDGIPSSPLY